jgi:hypothetical protein
MTTTAKCSVRTRVLAAAKYRSTGVRKVGCPNPATVRDSENGALYCADHARTFLLGDPEKVDRG